MSRYDRVTVSSLIGLTLTSVERDGDDSITFTASDGRKFVMQHFQDCCEHVRIESVVGDLQDLVGSPILRAEESSSDAAGEVSESGTWTFYKFATVKGYVDIRWLGESNGYYSESVDFSEVTS